MKRISLFFLILVLSLGAWGCASGSQAPEQDEQISELKSEISRLKSQIEEQRASYNSLLKEHTNTLEKLYNLQEEQTELAKKHEKLREKYEDLEEASDAAKIDELKTLRERISELQDENSRLKAKIAQLTEKITPSPDHALNPSQVWNNPEFKSTAWTDNYRLQCKVEEIARLYHRTHTYIPGETDCNDMAIALWNMLLTEDIKSVIVVGNLEKSKETLEESDHAWLDVFNAKGEVFYLEPTTGEVIYGRQANGSTNPKAIPYREGFIYEKPSDLWKDLGKRW